MAVIGSRLAALGLALLAFGSLSAATTARSDDKANGPAPAPSAAAAPAAAAPEPAEPEVMRGDRRISSQKKTPSAGDLRYRKRWALVVGIDYEPKDRAAIKDAGSVSKLTHAENDANSVAALLKSKYGYGDEGSLQLLTGDKATREEITWRLEKGFLGGPEIGKDDSVIFYFSGHGEREESTTDDPELERHPGYLLPIDFKRRKVGDREELFKDSAIDLAKVVELMKSCPARHKLLILDCCHSGTVFRVQATGVPGGRFDHQEIARTLFLERAFQAVTASRELASDGLSSETNSPFTRALLRALNAIPPKLERDRYCFTTNQLFHAMQAYFDGNMPPSQSPQCRWLDGLQSGEFHFFPDPTAAFVEEVTQESRQLLLAMVPSTFGNWWADEMPWFMPGLRLEILKDKAETRSSADEINKDKLRDAAYQSVQRLEVSPGHSSDPLRRMRLKHLRMMLQLDQQKDRSQQIQSVMKELKDAIEAAASAPEKPAKEAAEAAPKATEKPVKVQAEAAAKAPEKPAKVEAVDLHYLAVLQHKLGQHVEARTNYQKALKRYEEEDGVSMLHRPLWALCLLDLGMLDLVVLNEYAEAFKQFTQAESMFGLGSPAAFKIYCRLRQADALRRDGIAGPAERRMDEAINLSESFDPDAKHPLTAATWKYYGWACMEQWKFTRAEEKFNRAREILDLPENRNRDECEIDRFHVLHGLAMIHRFQGRDDLALEDYRDLTPKINREITDLETRRVDGSNIAEIRSLLYDRLVNSLDRQADCSMFGSDPDYAEAADDYRRALQDIELVPKASQEQVRKDILYRRVLALAMEHLHASKRPADGAATRSQASLIGLARHLAKSADDIGGDTGSNLRSWPLKIRLAAALAHGCLGEVEETTKAAGGDRADAHLCELRKLLAELRQTRRDFDRDELERLMFAYKFLIEREDGGDPYGKIDYAEALLQLCESAIHRAQGDPHVLKYLRQYYDAAFLAKVQVQPDRVKELIEVVWEATTGTPYHKPKTVQPVLAMYLAGGRCHLLLDPLRGEPTVVAIDRSAADLRRASASDWALSCPDDLRRALRQIDLKPNQRVSLIWRDPVERIGTLGEVQIVAAPAADADAATLRTAAGDPAKKSLPGRFPFDLSPAFPATSTPEQFTQDMEPSDSTPKIEPGGKEVRMSGLSSTK